MSKYHNPYYKYSYHRRSNFTQAILKNNPGLRILLIHRPSHNAWVNWPVTSQTLFHFNHWPSFRVFHPFKYHPLCFPSVEQTACPSYALPFFSIFIYFSLLPGSNRSLLLCFSTHWDFNGLQLCKAANSKQWCIDCWASHRLCSHSLLCFACPFFLLTW